MLENARMPMGALIANIQSFYTQEVLRQIHIILGSADFLGNPVGLFNNISSGVSDIFYEPYQGLVMTDRPQELGIGIAKGASSFVKNGATSKLAFCFLRDISIHQKRSCWPPKCCFFGAKCNSKNGNSLFAYFAKS